MVRDVKRNGSDRMHFAVYMISPCLISCKLPEANLFFLVCVPFLSTNIHFGGAVPSEGEWLYPQARNRQVQSTGSHLFSPTFFMLTIITITIAINLVIHGTICDRTKNLHCNTTYNHFVNDF